MTPDIMAPYSLGDTPHILTHTLYPFTEYVGHVASVECDFEPQQQCPWQLEAGTIINTQTGQQYRQAQLLYIGKMVFEECNYDS